MAATAVARQATSAVTGFVGERRAPRRVPPRVRPARWEGGATPEPTGLRPKPVEHLGALGPTATVRP